MVQRACLPLMLMIVLLAGGLLVPVGLSEAAFADSAPAKSDADACEPDVHRLCDEFFPDEKLVATCLVDKRTQLSEACAEVLARPPAADTGADAD